MKPTIYQVALLTCAIFILLTKAQAQEKISYGKDQCAFCSMVISDKLHASVALDKEGKTYKFDAIEGLINFLKDKEESDFEKLLVADYSTDGVFTDARMATYLKSKAIPSPMGAFLSGFEQKSTAEKVQREKGGELYDWKQIKARFKDSRFGVLNPEGHDHHDHHRPDAYAPIGVMGDHVHTKGDFMVSVRYMGMGMNGNISGTDEVTNSNIHNMYMVAPQKMSMNMYMVGVMYSPSPKLTMMIMQNIVQKKMELVTRMGMGFTTESNGAGDLKISALYSLIQGENSSFHLNSTVSAPVGSIKNTGDTPMAEGIRLPYPMQLGSGTYDISFGATYRGNTEKISWGVQQISTVRTGENSEGYRFGNTYVLNAWSAYKASSNFSFSLRMEGQVTDQIKGVDSNLNPMMVTTANVMNTGSNKIKSFLGVNVAFGQDSQFRNFTLGIEGGLPIYQDVDGIQMNEKETLSLGLRYSI